MSRRIGILAALTVVGAAALGPSRVEGRPAVPALQADTTTVAFEVNGLRVILRRNTANDVIGAALYLLGGTQQLTPATQGIEALLLESSERGTRKYPGPAMRQKTARLGTNIAVSPSKDWSVFSMRSTRVNFDSSWALFADRVMQPSLAPSEVDLIKSQMITALRAREQDPDELLSSLADSVTFAGHPYALAEDGTIESLSGLTSEKLREYHRQSFVTSRMLLVVVGNVERAKLEHLVTATLGTLPKGSYAWTPPRPLTNLTKAAVIRPAGLPTNYLMGYYGGPPASSPDYAALRVATAVLSGRFFTEIRSKGSLSYAADAPFVERAAATGGVYVTTVDPNATLRLMSREISRLQDEPIDANGLNRLVGQFLTDYFLKNETNLDQANFLARAAIYQGDFRKANQFVDELRRVRPEDVQRVAREYMHGFRFAYVGDPRRLDQSLLERF